MLKPGGLLVVGMSFMVSLRQWHSCPRVRRQFDVNGAHVRFFTDRASRGVLTKSGLRIAEADLYGRIPTLCVRGSPVIGTQPSRRLQEWGRRSTPRSEFNGSTACEVTRSITRRAGVESLMVWSASLRLSAMRAILKLMYSVRRLIGSEVKKRLVASPRPSAYRSAILSAGQGNALIEQLVMAAKPALVSRLGAAEVSCLRHYSTRRQGQHPIPYRTRVVTKMSTNAGFYPAVDDLLDDFCRTYLDAASLIDVLGVWYNPFEEVVANETCPSARLVPLTALEPYYYAGPWSRALQGLRVLVVHPFAASIRENYEANQVQAVRESRGLA